MDWFAVIISSLGLYGSGLLSGMILSVMRVEHLQRQRQAAIAAEQAYIRQMIEERKGLLWQNRIGRGL